MLKHTIKILVLLLLLSALGARAECVILLHGLGGSDWSLTKLQLKLEQHDFSVVNQDYPSTKKPIQKLSELIIDKALKKCPIDEPVSFVGHSMGGILVRYYLMKNDMPALQSVIMLGPPNQGSEVVDQLIEWRPFSWIIGPAGSQLGTGNDSLVTTLGDVDYNLGIIAGNYSINPILSSMIPGVDDGRVSVERTKLNGMRDHIIVPVSHSFMVRNDEVIEQVIHFLLSGQFDRSDRKS